MGRDLAVEYEKLYPGAVTDSAQKEERMERILHKRERSSLRRTGRTRGIIVPALPWAKEGVAA
ncbi:MAG: hypothetical protein NUW01_08830 [Gemmatimonadaceae bacterium]|nr:hypothetical protein [Gemmatimonadaceae bacterium]